MAVRARRQQINASVSVAGDRSGCLAGSAVAACAAKKQTVKATKVGPNASVTASTETVMFLTQMALDMVDDGCPGFGPQGRQDQQQAYFAAERACNQVRSGGRRCVAQNHFGADRPIPLKDRSTHC